MLLAYQIKYINETGVWFACGYNSSSKTLARSLDGINWTLLDTTIFNQTECYNIIYNGTDYIAVGFGTYPMAKSNDGINWSFITTTPKIRGYHIFNDGNRYIFSGEENLNDTGGNIWTSDDGIIWDTSKNISLPFNVTCIAYNNYGTYVAVGKSDSNINSYYWSNNLINWYLPNNNLMGTVINWVDWNGKYFTIGGNDTNGVCIIYSSDGKNWTASINNPFSTCLGIISITY
jgi:hypothetical protein